MLIFVQRTQITFTLMWAWNPSPKSSRQSLEQGLSLANLILAFTAASVRALEVDIGRPGLLCSALHAWLKCPLLRVLMPGMGVVLDCVYALRSRASNKGGTSWAPLIQPEMYGEALSSCPPAGQMVRCSTEPLMFRVFSNFISLHIDISGQKLGEDCNLFSHPIWLITLRLWSSPALLVACSALGQVYTG